MNKSPLQAIKMKDMLKLVPIEIRPQHDTFHANTGHVLLPEKSKVFSELENLSEYARVNGMHLNYKKTKVMVFNPCTSKDFLPKFSLDCQEIVMVEQTRFLGLILRNYLSWGPNTLHMVECANKKLWFLIRLKSLGS